MSIILVQMKIFLGFSVDEGVLDGVVGVHKTKHLDVETGLNMTLD